MPGLYALGQHAALLHLHAQLRPGEGLYAFLDDVYITTPPERTLHALQAAQDSLSRLANIQVQLKKTRAWNRQAWWRPCRASTASPLAGRGVGPCRPRLIVLGSPLGSREYIAAQAGPAVGDLQCAWLMLLLCAAPRSMYLVRTVPPSATDIFATAHDAAIGQCLATLLSGGDEPAHVSAVATCRAQLPLRMWGLRRPGHIDTLRTGPPGRTPSLLCGKATLAHWQNCCSPCRTLMAPEYRPACGKPSWPRSPSSHKGSKCRLGQR